MIQRINPKAITLQCNNNRNAFGKICQLNQLTELTINLEATGLVLEFLYPRNLNKLTFLNFNQSYHQDLLNSMPPSIKEICFEKFQITDYKTLNVALNCVNLHALSFKGSALLIDREFIQDLVSLQV